MATRNPDPSDRPILRQPRPARPLSMSLTRLLETVAARRRLLAERMPQPSQESEGRARG